MKKQDKMELAKVWLRMCRNTAYTEFDDLAALRKCPFLNKRDVKRFCLSSVQAIVDQESKAPAPRWHSISKEGLPKDPYDPRGYVCRGYRLEKPDRYFYEVRKMEPWDYIHAPRFHSYSSLSEQLTDWAELPKEPEEMVK